MKGSVLIGVFLIILCLTSQVRGQRGRGRGGKKSKAGIGGSKLPPGGKWRDEETSKYYMNPKGAKIHSASHFDLEYVLGHKVSFVCTAAGSPVPEITWFKDGIEIFSHQNILIHEWKFTDIKHGDERLKSKMEIDPAAQMDAGIYDCYADNKFAVDKRTFRADFITIFD